MLPKGLILIFAESIVIPAMIWNALLFISHLQWNFTIYWRHCKFEKRLS